MMFHKIKIEKLMLLAVDLLLLVAYVFGNLLVERFYKPPN